MTRPWRVLTLGWLVLLVGGCVAHRDVGGPASGGPDPSGFAAAQPVGWAPIAESPLGARGGTLSAWTGDEWLILGGSTQPPCPGNADCVGPTDDQLLTDGAAYDPQTDTWRPLADAPQSLLGATASWAGDRLVVLVPEYEFRPVQPAAALSYVVASDTWQPLAAAPVPALGRGVWNGSELFFPVGETTYGVDVALDLATGTWRELPPDPFGGSFDRSFTWVGDRFLVTGLPLSLVEEDGPENAPYQLAEYRPETDTWTSLAPTAVGFWDPTWFFVDGRLVNVSQDRPEGDGARLPPGGQLDLATGQWSAVPQSGVVTGQVGAGCPLPAIGVAGDWIGGGGPVLVSLDPPATTVIGDCADLSEPQVAAWTGTEILVWGGPDADGTTHLNRGYRWTPPAPG